MAFKNYSKRRDPDESDTAPALKPKRNSLNLRPRRDGQAKLEASGTIRRPIDVEQERDEPEEVTRRLPDAVRHEAEDEAPGKRC